MPGFGSRCLICAIATMLACTSATKARSWRYYGYDAIRQAFSQFVNELTDVQKAKLGRVVNVSTEITAVAH